MKRKPVHVLAIFIGLAALVLIVSYPPVWRALAYKRNEHFMGPFGRHKGGREKEITVLEKRFNFLPGVRFIIPDQVCAYCSDGKWPADHAMCKVAYTQRSALGPGFFYELRPTYPREASCICPTCHPERER